MRPCSANLRQQAGAGDDDAVARLQALDHGDRRCVERLRAHTPRREALGVVVDRMTRSVTSPGGLILATLVSCYLMTIGTGNGMLSIIVPARAFEKKFRDMGIQSRVLSRTLEDAVTLGIALVPYSMAAFFIVGVLKIDAMQYIPYAFLNWIVPIFSLTYGFTGFAIWKINKDAGNSPAESEA